MRIEGEVKIGEGQAYAGQAMAPITSAPWPFIITLAASMAGGAFAVLLANLLAEFGVIPGWLTPVTIIAFGGVSIWLSVRLCRTVIVRNLRRNLVMRGVRDPLPMTVEVAPEALLWGSSEMEYRIAWSAVSDVLSLGPYWVVVAQATPLFLPRRFFADQAAERAFIATLVERLSAPARSRSRDAVRFAGAASAGA